MPFGTYSRRGGRWAWRSWRGRSTYKSQVSGRRYFNISFPVESLVTATVPAGEAFSNVIRTCPYYHPIGTNATEANMAANACALTSSLAYRSYTRLYDSVKINSVSLTFSVATTVGQGGIPGLRVYSSWDRNLQWGEGQITYDQLITGPESQVVTFINNSRCKFYRSNRAADLQERTSFHDCTVKIVTNQGMYDQEWGQAQNTTVGYHPSISIVLQASNTTESSRTIPIQIQARYNVTFRNPKFGLSVADSAKFGETKSDIFEALSAEPADDEIKEEEKPVLKKKKVVYEEEVLPDDDDTLIDDDEEESQVMTQPVKSSVKKAGKKSS